jgi:hypothetical protein
VLRAARPFRRLPLRDAVADASSTGNCVHQCGSGSDGEPEFRAAFSGRRRAAPALQWPAVAPATGGPSPCPPRGQFPVAQPPERTRADAAVAGTAVVGLCGGSCAEQRGGCALAVARQCRGVRRVMVCDVAISGDDW